MAENRREDHLRLSRVAPAGQLSPEEFGKFVARETEKIGKVIEAAGISVK